MRKRCIVSVADGPYVKGQDRLRNSIEKVGFDGDVLFWQDELPSRSPDQNTSPMGFKTFAMLEAKRRGYQHLLWLDANMVVIRDLEPIFRLIEKQGVYVTSRQLAGVGEWSGDVALRNMGLTRDEAMEIPEIVSCCVGIDVTTEKGATFLDEWARYAADGESFRGMAPGPDWTKSISNEDGCVSGDPRVRGHRWDQTVASVLAHKHGVPLEHRLSFDVRGYATSGKKYLDYVPLDAVVVQNRDTKFPGDDYLREMPKYGVPYNGFGYWTSAVKSVAMTFFGWPVELIAYRILNPLELRRFLKRVLWFGRR